MLKATTIIRIAILADAQEAELFLTGEVEIDEAHFGGKRKGKRGREAFNKTPVSVFWRGMGWSKSTW